MARKAKPPAPGMFQGGADIEAMIEAGFERGQALTWLATLLPAGHPAPARLAAL